MITEGSLCTGYDGIGQGLRLAGLPLRSLWRAEVDEAVSGVLKVEDPDTPNVGDIKAAPWHLAPHVRLLTSGDPCQSISIAGRKAGRDDPRFLWPWVRDIYRQVQPKVIFLENVANIVAHDGGRTLTERLTNLHDDGYEVRWVVLGACAVGAPHHRHRWYALASHRGAAAIPPRRMHPKAVCGAPRSGGRWLLPTPNARDGGARGTPSVEHARRRAADPMRSLNLEDAVATLLPTPMSERSGNNRGGSGGRGDDQPVRPSLDSVHALLPTPVAYMDSRNATAGRSPGSTFTPGWTLADVAYAHTWGEYADAVALWERVTGVPAPEPTELAPKGGRRLSPALPEWMMGLRPGLLTDRLGRAEALKAAGNGVVPLAAAAAWRYLTGSWET